MVEMWYGRGIEKAVAEGSGQGEGRMRVSRRGRGGQGRSRERSNGAEPYLIACRESDGADLATTEVGCENCAREGTAGRHTAGGQQRVARRGVGVRR